MDPLEEEKFKISYLPTDYSYLQDLPSVKGSLNHSFEDFKNLGFEASRMYEAYELIKNNLNWETNIVLAFPSNLVSCGLRDYVTQLVKKKLVDVIITTAGGIEEDLIKTQHPFKHSSTYKDDRDLHQLGINRTENLYISNTAYLWLERHLKDLFKKEPWLYDTTPIELVKKLGENIKDQSSYLYWAWKNQVLVVPLCIEDGAIGDFYVNQSYVRMAKGLEVPCLNSIGNLLQYLQYIYKGNKRTLVICVGGNAPKHFALNGLIPFKGADVIVYLNNEPTHFGSNMGATPEEAISWGKSKPNASLLKVTGDFMFTFSLIFREVLKLKRT